MSSKDMDIPVSDVRHSEKTNSPTCGNCLMCLKATLDLRNNSPREIPTGDLIQIDNEPVSSSYQNNNSSQAHSGMNSTSRDKLSNSIAISWGEGQPKPSFKPQSKSYNLCKPAPTPDAMKYAVNDCQRTQNGPKNNVSSDLDHQNQNGENGYSDQGTNSLPSNDPTTGQNFATSLVESPTASHCNKKNQRIEPPTGKSQAPGNFPSSNKNFGNDEVLKSPMSRKDTRKMKKESKGCNSLPSPTSSIQQTNETNQRIEASADNLVAPGNSTSSNDNYENDGDSKGPISRKGSIKEEKGSCAYENGTNSPPSLTSNLQEINEKNQRIEASNSQSKASVTAQVEQHQLTESLKRKASQDYNYNSHEVANKIQKSCSEVHSLALFISFDIDTSFVGTVDKFRVCGFHPIFRLFKNYCYSNSSEVISAAENLVLDSAINCWVNAWQMCVFVFAGQTISNYITVETLKRIRTFLDPRVLDIIVISPSVDECPSIYVQGQFARAGATAVIGCSLEGVGLAISHIIRYWNKRGELRKSPVNFYNKDEPYYEFTNFYSAKVKIDEQIWPSTEHYFQAQKFCNPYLQQRIRGAWSAREAFTIARANDFCKREDWEAPVSKNMNFKENVMVKASFAKYRQNAKLKFKLLSTATARLFEHTENDIYWGDGGAKGGGRNRLGFILMIVRQGLMLDEIRNLEGKYERNYGPIFPPQRWLVNELLPLCDFEFRK
ncbi:hypothetical protein G9A89_017277 [Geosiphon pyriformis]|nr:hypothetical protein G9A89_017277 [Geosiphon pyriformis]